MEFRISGHDDCAICGEDGFIFRGFERTGEGGLVATVPLEERMEGWMGIPHGGIGMGAIMELASGLLNFPKEENRRFPVRADFRMGGARVLMGDTVQISVVEKNGGASGVITKAGEPLPYISGEISYSFRETNEKEDFERFLPKKYRDIENNLLPLPYYKNCFVCGDERRHAGLKRKFTLYKDVDKLVCVPVGFSPDDMNTFYYFHNGTILHPVASLALGDETMGWGGFFLSRNGGVSVRLSFTFYRDIRVSERLVFFGRGETVKGDISKRMMFWARGGACAVGEDGSFETVMTGAGQWLALPALTVQMNENLIPQDLTKQMYHL